MLRIRLISLIFSEILISPVSRKYYFIMYNEQMLRDYIASDVSQTTYVTFDVMALTATSPRPTGRLINNVSHRLVAHDIKETIMGYKSVYNSNPTMNHSC